MIITLYDTWITGLLLLCLYLFCAWRRAYHREMEVLVLRAITECQPDAYGVPIHRKLAEWGHDISYGQLYAYLDAMEERRLISGWYGDATPESGGYRRMYFDLREEGKQFLTKKP